MQRRHASLNILVRERLDATMQAMMDDGLSPRKALLAIMEGTVKGVKEGRNSLYAKNGAYEARYSGALMSEIARDRPHLVHSLMDPKMDADITIEMSELRKGGRPGLTGNDDAKYVAKLFSTYAELARTDLNRLGASIGKLDGWAGTQTHDDLKMIAAGKDAWIKSITPKLDAARTFPDVESARGNQGGAVGHLRHDHLGHAGQADAPRKGAAGQSGEPGEVARQVAGAAFQGCAGRAQPIGSSSATATR